MTYNEFIRWLKRKGVEVTKGKGRHSMKATHNGKTVPLPYHGSKEIGDGVRKSIIKQLGL